MYKDLITYRLAEGISEERLMEVAQVVVDSWMKAQKGFIKWEIHKNVKDQSYTDIVYWESREAAQAAETKMAEIPNAADWFSCYENGSIQSKNVNFIGEFGAG